MQGKLKITEKKDEKIRFHFQKKPIDKSCQCSL